MPKRKTTKTSNKTAQAQADRERQLRELIEQAETKKSGGSLPENESPHDFVERKMRSTPKPGDDK